LTRKEVTGKGLSKTPLIKSSAQYEFYESDAENRKIPERIFWISNQV